MSMSMFPLQNLLNNEIINNVQNALTEDVGQGDLTADLIVENNIAKAQVICRENAVICGTQWFDNAIFLLAKNSQTNLDSIQIKWLYKDGDFVYANTIICEIICPAKILLSAERTALNFLQTLSAVATKTKHFVDIIKNATNSTNSTSKTQIVDTRKTIPGLRLAQKYAVFCGGGFNHRIALWDAILIKENHIAAANGDIEKVLKNAQIIAKKNANRCQFIQIEVENLQQLQTAINCGAKMILLDNFNIADLYEAVKIVQNFHENSKKISENLVENKIILEISGNVNEKTLPELAKIGVDRISIGALTKDVKAIDLSMRFL